MLRVFGGLLALALAAAATGCGQEDETGGYHGAVLMDPQGEEMQKQAPDQYEVRFETSAGDFTLRVERRLAPRGADRFYNLVRHGFYDGQRFYRVVPGFVVQWGLHGDPEVSAKWHDARIEDDPVVGSNVRGTICFAALPIPNGRSTQIFINLGDNTYLDAKRFAPFGEVVDGMDAVDAINSEYGEQPGRYQQQIGLQGNEYLDENFPGLDYVETARIID